MQLAKFALVFSGFLGMLAPSWAADREWASESGAQRSFTTAIYNSDPSRLIVECRESPYLPPELSLTVVPSPDGKVVDGTTAEAIFATKDGSAELPMTLVGQGTDMAYRWIGIGSASVAPIRKIAEAVSSDQTLTVTIKGRPPMIFRYGFMSNGRMQDVALRCLPSVVRARRQASSLTNINTLLTLSNDANDRCRGGGVEDVWGACAERSEYGERLDALGMCFGKQGQGGYQMSWHRCGPGSVRPRG